MVLKKLKNQIHLLMKLKVVKKNCWKEKYKYVILLLVALFSFFQNPKAQNYHFSQFYSQPITLNPSLTGAFDGVFRASTTERSQWLSVTKPFLTLGLGVDGAIFKDNRRQQLLALGASVTADKAGDLNYTSLQALASLSYIKYLGHHGKHKVGLGAYAGMIYNTLDFSFANWDEQYQNGLFHPDLSSGENFSYTKQYFFDCGAGLFWSYTPNKTNTFQVGASAAHINRPADDFGTESSRLPVKWSTHFFSRIGLTHNLALEPMFYGAWQRKFREYTFGTNLEYFQRKNSYTTLFSFGGGLFYRENDALVVDLFFDWQNLRLGACYDLNVSKFIQATQIRGGFEITLSYIFRRKTITRLGKEPCPYDIM